MRGDSLNPALGQGVGQKHVGGGGGGRGLRIMQDNSAS